ncbi:PREDICTED: membrane-bound transcription factor site-2 protease-like, partial [Cyphomyrmex costatus]|uniref:membrane-bound transcription factor site-2 protease-like n=1 Tax=Cyphomyrmex costatus TaxID=456900 RepID=UPI000852360E
CYNIVTAILVFSTWLWAPLHNIGSGVYNSPVSGPTGLLEYDVIYKLNNCPVKHSEDWYHFILQAVQHSTPGYCVKQSFVQDYDESVPAKQKTNSAVNCCTTDSEINDNLCFEYIEGPQIAPLHLPLHSCLSVRAMLKQSQNFCQASHECLSHDTHCMKPLDNVTKIIHIKRKMDKNILFLGHPVDIYRTVDVSVFSAGLAIINIVPCFFLDGQYILNIVVFYLLNSMPHNRNIRKSTLFTITSIV